MEERIDLDSFLEKLISRIDKRLSDQETEIRKLKKALDSLSRANPVVDRSVMKVLKD